MRPAKTIIVDTKRVINHVHCSFLSFHMSFGLMLLVDWNSVFEDFSFKGEVQRVLFSASKRRLSDESSA